MKRLILTIACIAAIFIILTSPELVTSGVLQGIKLNLYSVIPALLPFIVLTNIMIKHNLCEYISFVFRPVLSKIFRTSSAGCFAIVIGFTCGYPMGAKVIGDLYKNNLISHSEACYLITFCNNCSITFLLNYILFSCLDSDIPLHTVLLLVYLPPVIAGIINKFLINPDIRINKSTDYSINNSAPILNAVKSISILSVYIICFTVISTWIASLSFLPEVSKCIIAGFTEITSGSNFIVLTIKKAILRDFLILACTVFGGFSILFQSFEQLQDTSLKKFCFLGKIEQLVIFCIFSILLFCK